MAQPIIIQFTPESTLSVGEISHLKIKLSEILYDMEENINKDDIKVFEVMQ